MLNKRIQMAASWYRMADGGGGVSIEISSASITETLTDIPILINISLASGINSIDLSPIFTEIGSNYNKLYVKTAEGVNCYVEVERWDAATNSAQIWFKAPSISSATNTFFNIEVGLELDDNPLIGVIGSVNGQTVWDNGYLHVWHLSQSPSGAGSIKDSVGTADGDSFDMDGTDLVDSFLGKGLEFDGVVERAEMTVPTGNVSTGTFELSIKATGTPATYDGICSAYSDIGANVFSLVSATPTTVGGYIDNAALSQAVAYDPNVWTHLSWSIDPTEYTVYNHEDQLKVSAPYSNLYFDDTVSLSFWYNASRKFPGIMKGCFLSDNVRTDNWRETSYKSRVDQFISYTSTLPPFVCADGASSTSEEALFKALYETPNYSVGVDEPVSDTTTSFRCWNCIEVALPPLIPISCTGDFRSTSEEALALAMTTPNYSVGMDEPVSDTTTPATCWNCIEVTLPAIIPVPCTGVFRSTSEEALALATTSPNYEVGIGVPVIDTVTPRTCWNCIKVTGV